MKGTPPIAVLAFAGADLISTIKAYSDPMIRKSRAHRS
jgi:hypothetical protein